eukprot:scaffold217279_cov46-Cyclotella_meneghiniana.AAC.1
MTQQLELVKGSALGDGVFSRRRLLGLASLNAKEGLRVWGRVLVLGVIGGIAVARTIVIRFILTLFVFLVFIITRLVTAERNWGALGELVT